ncbi:TerB family tellurite resistance protein [Stagnihabitans tardus]|uniref:TerB family tellurite resistance protein n=1 Tax=Stagnihabitans tardus TaxID=2699202 RepID=A0AAE4YGB4_9RHOB|nr:TerB family tellurite resistance protein [Stagnihabitans tardus]NBZ89440.1 TerB family tellurite resistance protein [Stagnihabitans tardus]
MSFLDLLFGPAPSRLPAPDEQLALAALLVRVARADGHASPAELARIDRILASRYALAPEAARALRQEAETAEQLAPDTVRFTRALKEAVPLEDRKSLVEALWRVALADGQRDAEEDRLLRLAANLLGLNDVDSALARQRAAQ